MWHRANAAYKHCIYGACYNAHAAGAALTTAHLLKSLREDRTGVHLLRGVGIVPSELDDWHDTDAGDLSDPLSLSVSARTVRNNAYDESLRWGGEYLDSEHLLIALTTVPDSAAGRFFAAHGVGPHQMRQALFDFQPFHKQIPPDVTVNAAMQRKLRKAALWAPFYKVHSVGARRLGALLTIGSDPLVLSHLLPKRRVHHPHGFFTRVRKRGLYYSRAAGCYIAGQYEHVQAVLRQPEFTARRYDHELRSELRAKAAEEQWPGRGQVLPLQIPPLLSVAFDPLHTALNRQMLFLDAPEQTRLRSLVSRQFTPRFIGQMQADIQKVADGLIDRVADRGEMDLIADFAFPLPATVIARLLGVPDDDLSWFKAWSENFVRFITYASSFPDDVETCRSLDGITDYFTRAINRERAAPPSQTLLSLLTHAVGDQGERLTDDEIITNAMLILAAGHETTTHLIANGLWLLLTHPDALQAVRDAPSRLPGAIEEMLRFEPPVQWTIRIVKDKVTLGEQTLMPGDSIDICLAAANRDPARFTRPDVFDITRTDNRHLGFGSGPHFCLGAALARMEAEIAFATLLRRLPDLKLKNSHADWRYDFAFRAQKTLPLVWTVPATR